MDRKWRALIVVCVAIFMLLLDITVVNVALPDIQRSLHTSFTDLQWVVDAYALMLATAMLNAGSLGDLLGRKRVFIAGVGMFTVASALCGAATSPVFLNLARGFQGIGGAVMFAVSLAIVSQEFHGRERGTAFGIWGATVGFAVAVGPMVGGALTTWAGWRWIFFVNLPIGVVCAAGAWLYLHESRDEEHAGFDVPGLLTLSAGLFALVLGLLRGNDWHWGSGREIGLFGASAALLVAFVVVEWRQASPMFDLRLFSNRTFTGAQIVAFSIAMSMFSMFLYLTLYLQNYLGYSPIAAGMRILPLSILSFVAAPLSGRLTGKLPPRILIGVGLALVGLSLALMSGIAVSSGWTTLLAGLLIGGFGIGMVNPPLATAAVGTVQARLAGRASGINNTFRQVGIATGIAVFGALLQSRIASELHNGQLAQLVASGIAHTPAEQHAFVDALNEILIIAAVIAFVGAGLGAALIRSRDFVQTGPAAGAHRSESG
ncbi:MAG: MFS transporter [Gaiellaceae bacterium]